MTTEPSVNTPIRNRLDAIELAKLIYAGSLPDSKDKLKPARQCCLLKNIRKYSEELAVEVAYFIYEKGDHIHESVRCVAIEIITGFPTTAIPLDTLDNTRALIARIPRGQSLEFTFKEESASELSLIFGVKAVTFSNEKSRNILENYVAKFRDWETQPRDYIVTLSLDPEDTDLTAEVLQKLVSSIRVVHSLKNLHLCDPSSDREYINSLNIRFNEGLYYKVLQDLNRRELASTWSRNLWDGSTAREILRSVPLSLRAHFWKIYKERHERLLPI